MKRDMILLVLLVMVACSSPPPANPVPRTAIETLEPLYEKLPPPGEGDWLAAHPEPGQTFAQYVASIPQRVMENRRTLYVAEVGDFPAGLRQTVAEVRLFLASHFGLPVKEAPEIPINERTMPKGARRTGLLGATQWLTSHLMDEHLRPAVPEDAAALLGFTTTDLWPGEGWNFVFGQASIRNRVGVYSLARLC